VIRHGGQATTMLNRNSDGKQKILFKKQWRLS